MFSVCPFVGCVTTGGSGMVEPHKSIIGLLLTSYPTIVPLHCFCIVAKLKKFDGLNPSNLSLKIPTLSPKFAMLINQTIFNGDLIVQNNSVLTIQSGITLDIIFEIYNITVQSGSGILIESGGTIT